MAKLVICLNLVLASMVLPARAQVLEGLVQLDKTSFDKIVSKFEYSLIKFDIGYPTGDKHKNFGKVATQVNNFNPNQHDIFSELFGTGGGAAIIPPAEIHFLNSYGKFCVDRVLDMYKY